MVTKKQKTTTTIERLFSGHINEKYQGKQVVLMGEKIHILPDDDQKAAVLIKDLEHKNPGIIPHLVTIPRPETYIL